MSEQVYFHDWEKPRYEGGKSGRDAVIADFSINESDLDGCEILAASYTYEDYSGSAYVLFRKDGKLWEVNGGHCSCYGLEGQWVPELCVPSHEITRRQFQGDDAFSVRVRSIFASEATQ